MTGTISLATRATAALHARIDELEEELSLTEKILATRQQVLDAIPECPAHGGGCTPHALEWIGNAKRLEAEQATLAYHAQGQAERIAELENHMDGLMITEYENHIAAIQAQLTDHERLLQQMQQAMTPKEWFDWQYSYELPKRWLAAAQATDGWIPVAERLPPSAMPMDAPIPDRVRQAIVAACGIADSWRVENDLEGNWEDTDIVRAWLKGMPWAAQEGEHG